MGGCVWLRVFVCFAALALACAAAPAQDDEPEPSAARGSPRRPGEPTMLLQFGFGGSLLPQAWTPVTVLLAGGDRAWEGRISLRFVQDFTQGVVIEAPAVATPGKTTVVPLFVSLPDRTSRITATLIDSRDRVSQRLVYDEFPSDTTLQLPQVASEQGAYLLSIGATTGPASSLASASDWLGGPAGNPPRHRSIRPAEMPLGALAYDGALVVAADAWAADEADPRAMAAVREWVAGGGRLLLFVPRVGEQWRQWLPPGEAGALVTVGEPVAMATPSELALVLELARNPSAQAAARPEEITIPAVAAAITGRPIALTETAHRLGWRQAYFADHRHGATLGPERPVGFEGSPLVAQGPVGLGWVTIVGFDPLRATNIVSNRAADVIVRDLLNDALADWREIIALSRGWWGGGTSLAAPSGAADQAMRSCLDSLADVPGPPPGAFAMIAIAMAGLAVMLGPVDAMVLKKLRLRHRSWLTALVWIAVASGAAYYLPTIGRTSESVVNRLSVIDAIAPMDENAAGGLAPAIGWRTSLTGVFAGAGMRVGFDGEIDGSWWRGVSSLQSVDFGAASRTALVVREAPAAPGAVERGGWGGFAARGSGDVPGATPVTTSLRMWTFRSFEDRQRIVPRLRVHVQNGEEGIVVRLAGVAAGARIGNGWVRVAGAWRPVSFLREGGGDGGGLEVHRGVAGEPTEAPLLWTAPPVDAGGQWGYRGSLPMAPATAMLLAGADRRTQTIDRLAETDGWAVVHLRIDDAPMDVTLTRGVGGEPLTAGGTHTQLWRIVAPISGGSR